MNEFVASNAQTQISRLKILIFNLYLDLYVWWEQDGIHYTRLPGRRHQRNEQRGIKLLSDIMLIEKILLENGRKNKGKAAYFYRKCTIGKGHFI